MKAESVYPTFPSTSTANIPPKTLSSSRIYIKSVGSKNSPSSLRESPRRDLPQTKELKGFLSNLQIAKTSEEIISQFYQVILQLSHETHNPPSPELQFLAARLLEVLNLKDPKTFTLFQLDGHSEKWPTWKKAHKLCKYLNKHGVLAFVGDRTKNQIDLSIQTITFINNFKNNKIVPKTHLEVLKCSSEEKFKNLIKETLDFSTHWDEQELKDTIESYLVDNAIDDANKPFYSMLAKTFNLRRLSSTLSSSN